MASASRENELKMRDPVSVICYLRTNQVRVVHVIKGSGHVLKRYNT